jgi:hypothetical protein
MSTIRCERCDRWTQVFEVKSEIKQRISDLAKLSAIAADRKQDLEYLVSHFALSPDHSLNPVTPANVLQIAAGRAPGSCSQRLLELSSAKSSLQSNQKAVAKCKSVVSHSLLLLLFFFSSSSSSSSCRSEHQDIRRDPDPVEVVAEAGGVEEGSKPAGDEYFGDERDPAQSARAPGEPGAGG